MELELDNNNHSVFLLWYHSVFVIKYRRKVINEVISNRLKEIFEYISSNYHIYCQEWNHDGDHIHVLFKAHPNSQLSKFINAYKSSSSRLIKKEYPIILGNNYEKSFFEREVFAYWLRVVLRLKPFANIFNNKE